jgi:hypothetical protein
MSRFESLLPTPKRPFGIVQKSKIILCLLRSRKALHTNEGREMTAGTEEAPSDDADLKIEVVPVDPEQIRKFTSEEEFMEVSVRLLVETASYVCVAACTLGRSSSSWDRDHAAVGGNVVRLYKLLHGLLDQLCQRRGELSFLFMRLNRSSIFSF